MDQTKYKKLQKRLIYKLQAQISLRSISGIRKTSARLYRLKKKYPQNKAS